MVSLWKLFRTFFLIGGFTFGGGHAMLPLIQEEIVNKKKWLTDKEFIDLFAVAQSLPGVFAVNMAIFIGYKLRGPIGAVACALGATLPSFLIILILALFFSQIRENEYVERVFKGLRPIVVAMIAAPVFQTWKRLHLPHTTIWIPIAVAIAVWYFGVSPVIVIIVAGALGYIYTEHIRRRLHPNKE
ncbi:chromate transporter [Porphyromonas canoris]|uniref:chromate transporter n=1 Tax=Porphyromonas canoris TaxID=36875 RepID=UPI00051DFD79|nr:chromate transporter [Porphyromonas canoris]KGL51809.1 chromate transporter [Porphyromonas canoris]